MKEKWGLNNSASKQISPKCSKLSFIGLGWLF